MSKLSLFTLFLGSSLLINCAANPFQQPPVVKKAIRKSLVDGDSAIQELEQFIKDNPEHNKRISQLLYAGELRRLEGNPQKARSWFAQLVTEYPTAPEKSVARLGMAIIDYEAGQEDQIHTLRTIAEDSEITPDSINADRYRILYLNEADSESEIAKRYAQKAKLYGANHPKTQDRIADTFGSDISNTDNTTADSTTETNEEEIFNPQDIIATAIENKDWTKAIQLSQDFLERYPESEYVDSIKASLDRAKAQDPYNPKTIAVLLPSTGKYAPAAKAIRQSLEYANNGRLDLKFYDTGWEEPPAPPPPKKGEEPEPIDPEVEKAEKEALQKKIDEKTTALIKKIVTEDGCSMIIGPLLKDVAPMAAQQAENYQIPLLSLSKAEDILETGEYIFRISIPISQQVDALLNHAFDDRGWKNFVAMVPDNDYGQIALQIFQQGVEERGGTLLRSVSYDPSATSFLAEARVLGLKPEHRPTEKELEKDPTADRPTMDFDAIFIPDNHRRVPLVVSSLAYEEFSIGSFRVDRHAEPTHAIGLNGWNKASIVDKGGQYLTNGVFVDAFWANSSQENVQNFVATYQEKFERSPNMYDALSHDAMEIAYQLSQQTLNSRKEVQTALSSVKIPTPVTGGTQFAEDRDLDRQLEVLIVAKDGIRAWETPADKPE